MMPVLSFTATESDAGSRLDTFIVARLSPLSRSRAGRLIRSGHVTVNGRIKKPGYVTKSGDVVRSDIPPEEPIVCAPEPIPLSILYEDNDVIVLNKPPGLVIHPGAGHRSGTLVNALLFHCPDLATVGDEARSGIVHRLDKDTSGSMVIAKNELAHKSLSQQFKTRKVDKAYLALVYGELKLSGGIIDTPIGRHPKDRKKMSTRSRRGRSTETHWKVKEAFQGLTLLEIDLKTGRTHQARVHCAAMGHPVVGDAKYGRKGKWYGHLGKATGEILRGIRRQMLHAWQITFFHPKRGTQMSFESPIPEDMATTLNALRAL
jgi:23S rRNA pseudouridine1911/1915/1917 synthase